MDIEEYCAITFYGEFYGKHQKQAIPNNKQRCSIERQITVYLILRHCYHRHLKKFRPKLHYLTVKVSARR